MIAPTEYRRLAKKAFIMLIAAMILPSIYFPSYGDTILVWLWGVWSNFSGFISVVALLYWEYAIPWALGFFASLMAIILLGGALSMPEYKVAWITGLVSVAVASFAGLYIMVLLFFYPPYLPINVFLIFSSLFFTQRAVRVKPWTISMHLLTTVPQMPPKPVLSKQIEEEETKIWKLDTETMEEMGRQYWVNVDKPTKTCTIHVSGCLYENRKIETEYKGIGSLKRDGGWLSFSSLEAAESYYHKLWKSQEYEVSYHSCLE